MSFFERIRRSFLIPTFVMAMTAGVSISVTPVWVQVADAAPSCSEMLSRSVRVFGVPIPFAREQFDLARFEAAEREYTELVKENAVPVQKIKTPEQKTAAVIVALKTFVREDLKLAVGDRRVAEAVWKSVKFGPGSLGTREVTEILDEILGIIVPDSDLGSSWVAKFAGLVEKELKEDAISEFAARSYPGLIHQMVETSFLRKRGAIASLSRRWSGAPWWQSVAWMALSNAIMIQMGLPHLTGWPGYLIIPASQLLNMRVDRWLPSSHEVNQAAADGLPLTAIEASRNSPMFATGCIQACTVLARRAYLTAVTVGTLWIGVQVAPWIKASVSLYFVTPASMQAYEVTHYVAKEMIEEDLQSWIRAQATPPSKAAIEAQRLECVEFERLGLYHVYPAK